jgi:hypothetical protein
MRLPGEVSRCRVHKEKSAEVVVVTGKRAVRATEVSQGDEGLNIESRLNSTRRHC